MSNYKFKNPLTLSIYENHNHKDSIKPICEVIEKFNVEKIIEIGSQFCGLSASISLEFPKCEIYAIDIVENPNRFSGNYKFIKGSSLELYKNFNDNYFDMIYLDSDHSFNHLIKELSLWVPKVKNGGIISGHDYNHNLCLDVKPVVDLCFKNIKILEYYNWYVIKNNDNLSSNLCLT